jgi:hypothetical protein
MTIQRNNKKKATTQRNNKTKMTKEKNKITRKKVKVKNE